MVPWIGLARGCLDLRWVPRSANNRLRKQCKRCGRVHRGPGPRARGPPNAWDPGPEAQAQNPSPRHCLRPKAGARGPGRAQARAQGRPGPGPSPGPWAGPCPVGSPPFFGARPSDKNTDPRNPGFLEVISARQHAIHPTRGHAKRSSKTCRQGLDENM